ncbi:MAG: hypothetical protein D8M58_07030 [Calditrichaeota bacterium]|nr:MAG: hypothetical protein DWQ03_19470 [Calditrichota bacterium]MBL1205133.1 hypothetical protein [Calditrichota bacterium]NOG44963.1 hypothetical protein [Calditrichota bacterium]
MAGVLLLQNKAHQKQEVFNEKCAQLKNQALKKFGQSFKNIVFKQPSQDTFIILFQKNEQQKYFSDDNGNWLAFEGTVYALHETKSYNANELWELYKNNPDNFANILDGHFVIKLHDAQKKQTVIINDFIKNKTNFWLETENEFMFTPFLLLSAVIKKPELDHQAFNEYLWRYYIMSERSMLKGVKRLQAASVFTITDGSLQQKRYWDFPKKFTKLSYKESLAKLLKSFKDTARLINTDGRKPLIEFTMGQDSRTILSAFQNEEIPFTTTIYGKEDFHEVVGVKKMAGRHGFKTQHVQLLDSFLNTPWQDVKNSILLGSAEEPAYLMGRILHMRKQYPGFSESLAINGVHGRFYKDGIWNEMYVMNFFMEPKSFKSDVFIKYRALNKNYRDDIFTDEYKRVKNNSHKAVKKLISDSISGFEESPMAIQADKFDLEHYCIFGTVGNNLCNMVIDLHSPLLFRRNLEFALTLPVKWRNKLSKIQRGIVHGLSPNLAKEKTDFGGINMIPKNAFTMIPFLWKYWFSQSKKFRDKLKSLMGISVKTQLQKAWDYLSIYRNFLADEEVQKLLNYEDMILADIIKKDEWQVMMKEYQNSEYHTLDRLEYLLKIVTVEYFLKNCREIS